MREKRGPFIIPNTTNVLKQGGAQIVRETADSYSKINVGGVTVGPATAKTAAAAASATGRQQTDGDGTDLADTTTYVNEEAYGYGNQNFGFPNSTKKD